VERGEWLGNWHLERWRWDTVFWDQEASGATTQVVFQVTVRKSTLQNWAYLPGAVWHN